MEDRVYDSPKDNYQLLNFVLNLVKKCRKGVMLRVWGLKVNVNKKC